MSCIRVRWLAPGAVATGAPLMTLPQGYALIFSTDSAPPAAGAVTSVTTCSRAAAQTPAALYSFIAIIIISVIITFITTGSRNPTS